MSNYLSDIYVTDWGEPKRATHKWCQSRFFCLYIYTCIMYISAICHSVYACLLFQWSATFNSSCACYQDTRTESGKATAKTFYAELAWRYQPSWSSGIGSDPRVAALAAQLLADQGQTHQIIACKIERACAYLSCSHHHLIINWRTFPSPYSNVMRTQTQGTTPNAKLWGNSDTQCHVKTYPMYRICV